MSENDFICHFDFNDQEITNIRLIYIIAALFSLFGSLYMTINFILKKPSSFLYYLVFCMGISDLFYSLSALITVYYYLVDELDSIWDPTEELLCQIQAGGIQYFQLSSFLWALNIAHYAYSSVVLAKPENAIYSNFKYYLFVGFIFPVIPLAILYPTEKFDVSDRTWCWIKCTNDLLRLYLFYVPLVIIYIFNWFCYFLVQKSIKGVSFLPRFITPITGYLLVFFLAATCPLLNRLLSAFGICLAPLYFLQAVFDPLLGFLNSLIYGYSNFKELYKRAQKLCCKDSNESEKEEESRTKPDRLIDR